MIQQQSREQQQRLRELEPRVRPPERLIDDKELDKPEAPAAAPPEPQVRFLLKQVRFTASQLLTREELAAVAAEYQGRQVAFSDLQALVAKVDALYRSKGQVAAKAIIPAQDVTSGIVTVQLIEGRLGRFELQGNATTQAGYILERMRGQAGALLDIPQLEADLVRFNRTNDVQVAAQLKPGQSPETTDVQLVAKEPSRHGFRVFADNAGIKNIGELRQGLNYQNRSLLGFRDELGLTYTRADGHEARSLGYAFPVNRYGGRLHLGYSDDPTQVKFGDLAALNITGKATSWTGLLRQPLIVEAQRQLDATLSIADLTSQTLISGIPVSRVESFDTAIGAEYRRNDPTGTWLLTAGLTEGRADAGLPSKLRYSVRRANVRRDQDLPGNLLGRVKLALHDPNTAALPNSSRFFIGGAGTVRGYTTAAYGGVSGHIVNLELHRNLLYTDGSKDDDWPKRVTGFLFYDQGQTRPSGAPAINLASVGFGSEFALGHYLSGQITLGNQLRRRAEEARTYRIDFTLAVQLF